MPPPGSQDSHRHVLVLGKDRVVALETVLFKVLLAFLGSDLDVELGE